MTVYLAIPIVANIKASLEIYRRFRASVALIVNDIMHYMHLVLLQKLTIF